ncbi:hypothetical protein M422DRAFT_62806 [Sphaerobolus stellatus SS14]|nr:hypothetical protein M422DRAFT_62806 [Sphaerobolus stellatus SS14]
MPFNNGLSRIPASPFRWRSATRSRVGATEKPPPYAPANDSGIFTTILRQLLSITRTMVLKINVVNSMDPKISLESVFYSTTYMDKSPVAWIVLNAKSDDPNQEQIRYDLLDLFLEAAPLSREAREELYRACMSKSYNLFFRRVRMAKGFRSFSAEYESCMRAMGDERGGVDVVPKGKGFRLQWFVPDLLGRIQREEKIGIIEFVAQCQVWCFLFGQGACLNHNQPAWCFHFWTLDITRAPSQLVGFRIGFSSVKYGSPQSARKLHWTCVSKLNPDLFAKSLVFEVVGHSRTIVPLNLS